VASYCSFLLCSGLPGRLLSATVCTCCYHFSCAQLPVITAVLTPCAMPDAVCGVAAACSLLLLCSGVLERLLSATV
jgi:hypothetical protein